MGYELPMHSRLSARARTRTAERASNGHCHAVWNLATPVHRGPQARPKPLYVLARVAEYFTQTAKADPGYNGVLTHNPKFPTLHQYNEGQQLAAQHPAYPHAVDSLYRRGAHFVLCNEDKKPRWTGYLEHRAGPDLVLAHEGLIGIVPWRGLRKTVMDVDHGNYRNITKPHPPWYHYQTGRAGGEGRHLWYDDYEGRGSPKWSALGCSGELRGTKGIVVLHGDALVELWNRAITSRPEKVFPFPSQLMLFSETELGPIQAKPLSDTAERKHTKREWGALADAAAEGLYTAVEGNRHDAHFDALRYWAYSVNTGGDLTTWLARVNQVSDQLHGRIPVPESAHRYSRTQSRDNAGRVATFTWNLRTDYLADYSSEAQRRRIVKRWHGQGSEAKVLQVEALHAAIRFDFGQGLSVKEIARGRTYGERHIRKIVAAEREATKRREHALIRAHVSGGPVLRQQRQPLDAGGSTFTTS